MKLSYILNSDPIIGEFNKYYYFYKIICISTQEYYYGVHSTNNLNDGYSGSGKNINNLYKKYENPHLIFKKYILKFFKTELEMYDYERTIITPNLLKDKKCLNISIGGIGSNNHNSNFTLMYYENKTIHVLKNEVNLFKEYGWANGISPNNINIYVHNNNETIKIKKNELNKYLSLGYIKGKHENDKPVFIHNDTNEIKIDKNQLNIYLENGWKLGRIIDMTGKNNGAYNKVWIYKDGTQKYINKADLNKYIDCGWINKYMFENKRCKNTVWINNNINNLRINKEELNDYLLTNNWFLGRIGYKRKNTEKNSQKRIWVHNENESKCIPEKDIDIFINKGYKFGRLPLNSVNMNKANINKIWINKDNINKRIFLYELDEYILSGWIKGRLNHKKYERRKLGI